MAGLGGVIGVIIVGFQKGAFQMAGLVQRHGSFCSQKQNILARKVLLFY